jgi:ferritin-like metal-binding protein YciE
MALASLKDLYLDELGDLYAAETQMLRVLPRWIDAARAPELRDLLHKHYEESRLHLERLQLIFTHWGERAPVAGACPGMAGIVQEADERLNQRTTEDVQDAAIIGVAQRAEHYEIAAYGCARTYARRLSRPDEARLLQETLDEEGRADHRLTELAEAHINDDARAETDFVPSATRFRYVDRRQLDHSRLTQDALAVRNGDDEELGTFDGLVITSSADPRYIVVDARALFSGRRYLLPVREVTFDERARVLRVNLSKDLAERYPEFDPEQFRAMDSDAIRGYHARIMEFFHRDTGQDRAPRSVDLAPPEWLMTGVWITLTPEHAAGLSNQARSFANEFAGNTVDEGRDDTRPNDLAEVREPVDVAGPAQDVAGPNPSTVENPWPRQTSEADRMIAHAADRADACDPGDSIAPPHGDKLRDKAR